MPYSPRDLFYDVVTMKSPEGFLIPLANIQVSVYAVDNNGNQTALATIYGSRTGGSTPNDFITGADGVVKFWAPPGDYNIVFTDTEGSPRIAQQTIGWQSVSGKAEGILAAMLPVPTQQAVLPGEMKIYGGDLAPAGYVLCDGSTYDGTVGGSYAALFDVIGIKFGGTGRTSFKVPDMRGRVPVGKGTHVDVDTIGDNDGLAVGSRRPKHAHSQPPHTHSVPAHSHLLPTTNRTNEAGGVPTADAGNSGTSGPWTSGSSGGDNTGEAGVAYKVINYIIKL